MIRRDFLLPFFWRIVAAVSSVAGGLITLRLYRHLVPEEFGVVVVALQIINYLPLLDGGFKVTVNRQALAQGEPQERLNLLQFYQKLQFYITGLALLVGAICMVAYSALPAAREAGLPLSFFMTLALIGSLTVGSGLQAGLLIGLKAQEQTFLLNAVNNWLYAGVLWLALRLGSGVWAFPLAQLAMLMATYALAIGLIHRLEPGIRILDCWPDATFRRLFTGLRSSAWECFRSQIVMVLLYTVDLVFVLVLCGPKQSAAYAVLSRVFGMMRAFLQSSGEVTWPIVAQRGMRDQGFRSVLLRGNAWVYGSVAGASCLTVLPFCRWYVGPAFATNNLVLYLVAARFVVTGLATPAAYVLYGLGEFKALTRSLERELIAACILAVPLGWAFQLPGVAGAFLLATAFGTLFPMIRAYARKSGETTRAVLLEMWWRMGAGCAYSAFWALYFLNYFPAGLGTLVPAAVGLLSGLTLALVLSILRTSRPAALLQSLSGLTQLLKRI